MRTFPLYKKSKLLQAKLSPFQKAIPKFRQRKQNFIARPKTQINLYNNRLAKYFYFLHKQKPDLLNKRLTKYERRIDVALFRVNFCRSIRAARQLICHGKAIVNKKTVKSANMFLKPGDVFSLVNHSFVNQTIPEFNTKLSKKDSAFEVNYANLHAVYLYSPAFISFPFKFH